MTLLLERTETRRERLAPCSGRAPLVECPGYLADGTVFNLIRPAIEDAIARHRITAPVFVCHSLGCFIGLAEAAREIGAHVIAINMPASPWHGLYRAAFAGLRMSVIKALSGSAEAALFRDAWVYFGRAHVDDLERRRLRRIHEQCNRYTRARRRDIFLFLKTVLLEYRRRGPHAPRVLLLQGDRDPLAPERDEARFRRRLPRSSVVAIPGAHVLPATHPREVARAIDAFFAEARTFGGAHRYR